MATVTCARLLFAITAVLLPRHNEILTGGLDPRIDSNAKVPNRNTTVLEWVNRQPIKGRVAAFASWDVLGYHQRSAQRRR